MKKKYYLIDRTGRTRIFSSFNSLLRTLRLSDEQELKLADVLGTAAFTSNEEKSYEDEDLGIKIEYK